MNVIEQTVKLLPILNEIKKKTIKKLPKKTTGRQMVYWLNRFTKEKFENVKVKCKKSEDFYGMSGTCDTSTNMRIEIIYLHTNKPISKELARLLITEYVSVMLHEMSHRFQHNMFIDHYHYRDYVMHEDPNEIESHAIEIAYLKTVKNAREIFILEVFDFDKESKFFKLFWKKVYKAETMFYNQSTNHITQ